MMSHMKLLHHIFQNKRINTWFGTCYEEYYVLIREVFDQSHQVLDIEKIRILSL